MLTRQERHVLQWLVTRGVPCRLDDIRILLLFEPGLAEISLQSLERRNLIRWQEGLIEITPEGREALNETQADR